MPMLVLLRHGESEWNRENLFTGWMDVDLDEYGREQARQAGRLLQASRIRIDVAHTSYLTRAIRTLWIVLDEMRLMYIPEYKSWRLNERHYGALQGLNKSQTAVDFGESQVKTWRRSYAEQPPALLPEDRRSAQMDPRYENVDAELLPLTESLKDTFERVYPYWNDVVEPQLRAGQTVLIAAHGNTLRSLVKHLDRLEEQDFMELNIPIGEPLVYELDAKLRPVRHYYLNSEQEIQRGVRRQIEMGQAFINEVG